MVRIVTAVRQPTDRSPSGLPLRHLITGEIGSTALYVGEQWLTPGDRVRLHTHTVEEVLIFTAGTGELTAGDETHAIGAGVTAHIPPGEVHGFRNTGTDELRVFVLFPGNRFADTVIVG